MTIEERTHAAGKLYVALVDEGMSHPRAEALASSVYDLPKDDGLTKLLKTRVEHTGVFGLWFDKDERWVETEIGTIMHGPRCVMEAELRSINTHSGERQLVVREFAPDGQPVLAPEAVATAEV